MNLQVVGIQKVDYVSKKTNQPVTGLTFHVLGSRKDVEGEACETIFVSSRSDVPVEDVKVGSVVEVSYNRFGSVQDIILVG